MRVRYYGNSIVILYFWYANRYSFNVKVIHILSNFFYTHKNIIKLLKLFINCTCYQCRIQNFVFGREVKIQVQNKLIEKHSQLSRIVFSYLCNVYIIVCKIGGCMSMFFFFLLKRKATKVQNVMQFICRKNLKGHNKI